MIRFFVKLRDSIEIGVSGEPRKYPLSMAIKKNRILCLCRLLGFKALFKELSEPHLVVRNDIEAKFFFGQF